MVATALERDGAMPLALWMTILVLVLAVGALLWVIKVTLKIERRRPGFEEVPLTAEQKRKEAEASTVLMILMIAGL